MRRFAFLLLLGLVACNRHGVADVTLDADAAQRNATAQKTIADLAAADTASQGPAPTVRDSAPVGTNAPTARAAPPGQTPAATDEVPDADDTTEAEDNQ
jgi:hypothetical protein